MQMFQVITGVEVERCGRMRRRGSFRETQRDPATSWLLTHPRLFKVSNLLKGDLRNTASCLLLKQKDYNKISI